MSAFNADIFNMIVIEIVAQHHLFLSPVDKYFEETRLKLQAIVSSYLSPMVYVGCKLIESVLVHFGMKTAPVHAL